jgi:hypothetical protein
VSGATDQLLDHYNAPESLNALGGRCLVLCKGSDYMPVVRRSDEIAAKKPAFALGR